MTRAESLLVIIGDHGAFYANKYYKRLIDYCIEMGSITKDGRKLNPRIQAPR